MLTEREGCDLGKLGVQLLKAIVDQSHLSLGALVYCLDLSHCPRNAFMMAAEMAGVPPAPLQPAQQR